MTIKNFEVRVSANEGHDGESGLIHIEALEMYEGMNAQISFIFSEKGVKVEARNPFDGSVVKFNIGMTKEYFGEG